MGNEQFENDIRKIEQKKLCKMVKLNKNSIKKNLFLKNCLRVDRALSYLSFTGSQTACRAIYESKANNFWRMSYHFSLIELNILSIFVAYLIQLTSSSHWHFHGWLQNQKLILKCYNNKTRTNKLLLLQHQNNNNNK